MYRQRSRSVIRIATVFAIIALAIAGATTAGSAAFTNTLGPFPGWVAQTEPQDVGPIVLPGRLEAEDYREGGEGVGYSDWTSANLGGEYRIDAVDIQTTYDTDGAYNVGWIRAGEWLAYDVEVGVSADYVFSARVATINDCRSVQRFHIELDGTNVTGPMTVPNTGRWQGWTDSVSAPVSIPAGSYTLKIVAETGDFNLNYVKVSEAATDVTETIALPGQFEAENYRSGGPGVGFHDTDEGNFCGAYRGDDVDIQICDDGREPCYNIAWVDEGEWLAYDVHVTSNDDYTFTLRTATIYDDRRFRIEMNGTNITGSITVPNSDGWHTWADVTSYAVSLAAGSYTLKIVAETGEFNVNHIQVRAAGTSSSTESPATLTHLFLEEGW